MSCPPWLWNPPIYATTAAYLSIPGWTPPNGGQREALRACSNQGELAFRSGWRQLKLDGYLHSYRVPIAHQKFHYYYTLSKAPQPVQSVAETMTNARRSFNTHSIIPYAEPEESYTLVPKSVLWRKDIGYAAKGLFVILCRALELAGNAGLLCTKELVLSLCDGQCCRRGWAELSAAGILAVTPERDAAGRWCWRWTLHPEAKTKKAPKTHTVKKAGTPETANAASGILMPSLPNGTGEGQKLLAETLQQLYTTKWRQLWCNGKLMATAQVQKTVATLSQEQLCDLASAYEQRKDTINIPGKWMLSALFLTASGRGWKQEKKQHRETSYNMADIYARFNLTLG